MISIPSGPLWKLSPTDREAEIVLQRELGIERIVAAALVDRGIRTKEEADAFLHPRLDDLHDPKFLPDYDAALKHILGARERGDLIFLHGDYDVDGVTSTALFYRFLTKIGCKVHPHVPHRIREGYGIHEDMVDEAIKMGAKLFLTCDCGASALPQIEQAREAGLDVVVTDHHHVGNEFPRAHAYVNPHRADSNYPFDHLCGVGVVFKLCQGITQELDMPIDKFQRAYLDLVALGTIADVMPLIDENRILVRHGLPCLSQTKKPGLVALYRAASLTEKAEAGFDTYNVGFGIGPRLNAAGRIDDSVKSLRLLLADTFEEATPIANELENLNQRRKEQQELIIQEALEMVVATGQQDSPIIILGGELWHPGIVGIVAGRIKDKFHRPVFVLALDESGENYKGSGRSIAGFHLAEAIEAHSDLVKGGGHAKAAGMSVPVGMFDETVRRFTEFAAKRLSAEDMRPTVEVTAETNFREITLTAAEQLKWLEPFGEGNRSPIFGVRGAELRSIKPTKNPDHPLPFFAQGGSPDTKFTAFGMGSRFAEMQLPATLDILFELGVDEWRGSKSVGWRLKDFAPSEA